MKETFDYFDGQLCLRSYDTQSNDPVAIIAHYSFGRFYQSEIEHLLGKPAIRVSTGCYGCNLDGHLVEFQLVNGGQTLPFKFEKLPLEKPVSKRKTRWYYGRWQQLFATGWKDYFPRAGKAVAS